MTTSASKHKIEINYERLNNHTSSYITISHVMVGYVTRGYLIYKSRKGFHHVSTGEFYTLTPGIYMVLKQADSIGIFEHVTLHIDRRSLISPEFAEEVYIDPDVERMDRAIIEGITRHLSIDELAPICCMTTSTFKRRFHAIFGESPHSWIMERRMEIAEHLLIHSELKMHDVGRVSGFINDAHFSHYVKRRCGYTPSEIRRNRGLRIRNEQQIFSL